MLFEQSFYLKEEMRQSGWSSRIPNVEGSENLEAVKVTILEASTLEIPNLLIIPFSKHRFNHQIQYVYGSV